MKKILSLLVSMLLLATPVLATEEMNIVDAGITPDSPIYGLDRAMERIQLALTFREGEKAKLHYKFAEERLSEAEAIAEENPELAEEMMEDYEEELTETNDEIEKAVARGQNVEELIEHVTMMTSKHLEVLQRVHDKVPERARAAIAHAMEVSARKQVGVLAHMEDGEQLRESIRARIEEKIARTENRELKEKLQRGMNEGFEEEIEIEDETEIEEEEIEVEEEELEENETEENTGQGFQGGE